MDKDMKVLPVEGSELTYRVTGDGPPVLLIHGGFGVIEVWDEIEADLAKTHRVIAYDRRGHGRSPNGTSDLRVHARDAAELIEHVAERPAIIVGWSAGAAVALETVRAHADQVKAAVVIESGFHPQPSGGDVRHILRAHLHWLRGRNRAAAETIGRTFFARRSGGNGWDEIDDDHRELLLGDAEGLRVEVRPMHRRYGTDLRHIKAKDMSGWSTPMTFMIGEDTMPLLARCHDRLTGAAPQARTIKVSGACHLIPWQQPEAVVSAVRSAIRA